MISESSLQTLTKCVVNFVISKTLLEIHCMELLNNVFHTVTNEKKPKGNEENRNNLPSKGIIQYVYSYYPYLKCITAFLDLNVVKTLL